MTEASIRACRGIELVRTVIATGLALVACAAGASGQDRMITLSATAIRPGTAVRITSTTCTGDLTLLVDGTRFPATLTGTNFELVTASLAPGTYAVATDHAGPSDAWTDGRSLPDAPVRFDSVGRSSAKAPL